VLDRAGHGLYTEQEKLCHALFDEWIDRAEEFAEAAE
jgi:alpha-beta hydrolase superfamily lysophospholipase